MWDGEIGEHRSRDLFLFESYLGNDGFTAGSSSITDCFYVNGVDQAVTFVCESFNGTYPKSNCYQLLFKDNLWATNRAKLKALKIGSCRGSGFNEDLFKTFENLREFDFSFYGVTYLNSKILNLRKLEILNASHNLLPSIPSGLFSNTPNITDVDFSYNKFTSVDEVYFKGAAKLTKINFSHNQISVLNSAIFKDLNELHSVDLSSNLIRTINKNLFNNNHKLKVLRLDNNPLQTFDFLPNFMKSASVNITLNHISRLDVSSLGGSVQVDLVNENEVLFRLTESNSKLIIIKESFESLNYLNISGNHIENTAQIVDLLGSSIETLDVSSNFMEKLNVQTFEKFINLKSLNVKSTNLSAINFDQLQNVSFSTHNKNLESLNLESNPIVRFDCNIFTLLKKSVAVQVSCDHIKEIDTSCMENALKIDLDVKGIIFRVLNHLNRYSELKCRKETLQNVKYLNISSNELENTPQIIALLGSSIEILDVSLNFLRKLDANIFEKFENLKYLNLKQTQLSKISSDTMHHLPFYRNGKKLQELYMDRNPIERFDCNVLLLLMSSILIEVSWENVKEIDTSCMGDSFQMHVDKGKKDVIFQIPNDNSELHCLKEHFQKLIYFNISGNHFKNTAELIDLFGPALQTLDASSNFIGKLKAKTFKKLLNLQYLNLSNTNLSNFCFNTFYHQTKLKTLDLSFNRMRKVDFTLFLRNFRTLTT
ncbi:chaoptin-like, partial [Sitodiplosis mosellana]|uniref:chaoptin-like n=1 Tax=Sitodiplosis mosellana TaxID=263140 RepID=UPI0024452027